MIKRVNITARIPVKNVTPPIHGHLSNIKMDTADILKCLNKRAIVEEILDNGSTVRLTIRNYYTDNNVAKKETTPKVVNKTETAAATAQAKMESKKQETKKITAEDVAKVEEAAVVTPTVVDPVTMTAIPEEKEEVKEEAKAEEKAIEVKEETTKVEEKKDVAAETKTDDKKEEVKADTTATKTDEKKKVSLNDTMIPARNANNKSENK